jgi:hypothetical protein
MARAVLLFKALVVASMIAVSVCGPFLAINTFSNGTIAAVSVDSSGVLTYLSGADNKILQAGVFSSFPSAVTSGNGGLFYTASMISGSGDSSIGAVFVFGQGGAHLVAGAQAPYPPIALAEDTNSGKLYSVVFDLVNDTLMLVSWELPLSSSSQLSLVGMYPKGWLGTSSGGCYDPNGQVFYISAINTAASAGNIFGMHVTDGTIVSTTPNLDQDTFVSSVSCDSNQRYVVLAQSSTDPDGKYFLATVDVTTGNTTPVGSTTFLTQDWTIMSVSINSAARKWVGTFQDANNNAALLVADLDTGKVLQSIKPWTQGAGISDLLLMP